MTHNDHMFILKCKIFYVNSFEPITSIKKFWISKNKVIIQAGCYSFGAGS